MSQAPATVSLRVSTGQVTLPVELRDRKLRMIDRKPSDQSFKVSPGLYVVCVRLPWGDKILETVDVPPEGITIQVEPAPGDLEPRPPVTRPTDTAGFESLGPFGRGSLPDWTFRFWQVHSLTEASPDAAPEVESVESQGPSLSMVIRVPQIATFMIQIARTGEVPLNVFLPAAAVQSSNRCRLTVTRVGPALQAAAFPASGVAGLAAQYLASGQIGAASQLLNSAEAEDLLRGKMSDPFAAAVGGYVLLRQGALDRMHDWPENLASWFPWLADGAVVAAERIAMQGDPAGAVDRLLEIRERGLPVFSDGFSMLVARLRRCRTNPVIRARLPERQLRDAEELLESLQDRSLFADLSSPTTTYRAAAPSDPAESQVEIEGDANSGFFSFDLDAKGRMVAGVPMIA